MMQIPSLLSVVLCSLSLFLRAEAATEFSVPLGSVIVCSDSLDNVCRAPTSCNKNGKVDLDSGNNFNVGDVTQRDGVWTVTGGYKIKFPDACDVQCQGDCVCEGCESTAIADFVGVTTEDNGGSGAPQASAKTSIAAGIVLTVGAWMLA